MEGLRGADGELYLLGLCEGNHCAQGAEGMDQGNGVIHVLKKKEGQVSVLSIAGDDAHRVIGAAYKAVHQ
jgi:hypothetical protein